VSRDGGRKAPVPLFLTMMGVMEAFAGPVRHVYIHVPFCTARCDYCDFEAEPVGAAGPAEPAVAALFERYVAAVGAEWERERAACDVRRVASLYLGGGTPALLGPARLERIVAGFDGHLTPRAEMTVETNPDEADAAFAAWAATRGVRVSLGVQSFDPMLRAALGRRPAADPAAATRRLRTAGVRDLSIDLMHGIPGQTTSDLDADLGMVDDLAPDHVSWYELDVSAGTPLARRLRGGHGPRPPARAGEDERAAQHRHVVSGLECRGYRWYEVSNFARPGRQARHNVAYWRARPYLGLGPGAVSTVGRRRWRNAPGAAAYGEALAADRLPHRHVETLDATTLARERLMLAARCGLAVPIDEVAAAIDAAALAPLGAAGLLSLHSGTIRVTRKGRYVANEVCVRLFRA